MIKYVIDAETHVLRKIFIFTNLSLGIQLNEADVTADPAATGTKNYIPLMMKPITSILGLFKIKRAGYGKQR
jgi:hypothetical protein